MRTKRCKVCGAIIYDEYAGDICDVCLDDMDDKNFYDESSETTTEEDSE